MFKKIGYIIVFLLLFIVSGCDESEDFKGAGASSISYPLNTSPLMTDQALGIDDPTGTWAINRFSFADVFTLYLTQDFTFTGAIDTTNATSNTSGPIALTPTATLPIGVDIVDGKIFPFTGLAGFLSNSVFTMYDGTTPVYYIGIKTPPTTTGETIGFNQVTGDWDIVTPSGGASITEVATAPDPWDLTPGNLTIAQDTGTEYYLYADGSKVITRLADTSTDLYSMDLVVASSGSITINSTAYTSAGSPYIITSLSGVTAMTAAYGSPNDTLVWSGTDSGDVSGTYPNYSITMDASKTLIATFSESTSVLLGSNVIGDTAYVGSTDQAVWYEDAFPQTPFGTAAIATGTANEAVVYISTTPTTILNVLVSDSDGLIISKGAQAVTAADNATWVTVTLDTPVSIVNTTLYGLAVGTENAGTNFIVDGTRIGSSAVSEMSPINWATITDLVRGGSTARGPLSAYLQP